MSPDNEMEISNKRRSDDRYQGDDLEGKRRRYQDEGSTGPSQSPTRCKLTYSSDDLMKRKLVVESLFLSWLIIL